MRRMSRLVLATAFAYASALATGCAALDSWYTDGTHATEYPREAPPQPPKEASTDTPQPTSSSAGIYTEAEQK